MRPLGFMLKPIAVGLTLGWPCSVSAQTPVDFYKGKTIEIDVSSTAGGGYDTHARLLARHMPKYIPGHPAIVVKNVDGASGLRLANLLYNTAPKDGTIFGTIYRSTSFDPLFGNKAAHFDASNFTWIGSASNEVSVCVAWHTSDIASFEDMLARELIVATGNQGGDATQFTTVVNAVFGTRMKMVSGYPGGNDMLLAMERGEVAAVAAGPGRARRPAGPAGSPRRRSTSCCSSRLPGIQSCRAFRSSSIWRKPTSRRRSSGSSSRAR